MRHVLIIQYLNDFLVLYEWFFVAFLKLNGEYQEKMTFFYAVSICPKSELLLQLICPESELSLQLTYLPQIGIFVVDKRKMMICPKSEFLW